MMGISWWYISWIIFLAAQTLAGPLTTITPCLNDQPTPPPITVTSQYQTVSTCRPKTHCFRRSCSTRLEYSTWQFVSTTIPCAWNGHTARSTLVTNIKQHITVSTTVITANVSPTSPSARGHGPRKTPRPTASILERSVVAPYDELGALAIPGYGGSGLCKMCKNAAGAEKQVVTVRECHRGLHTSKCSRFVQTWTKGAMNTPKPTAPATTMDSGPSSGPEPWDDWHFPTTSIPSSPDETGTSWGDWEQPHSHPWWDWPGPTSALSIPAPTTTTSLFESPPPSPTELFRIQLQKQGSRFRKRAPSFIKFDGDDAYATDDILAAAVFHLSGTYLLHKSQFVGSSSALGAAPLQQFSDRFEQFTELAGWTRNGDRLDFERGTGFCVAQGLNILIEHLLPPAFQCGKYEFIADNVDGSHPASSSTTTASTTSRPSSTNWSTTTTIDISADMDFDGPTAVALPMYL